MVDVVRAELCGKLEDIGPLRLLRAEWWKEAPQFVLLRYSLNGRENERGVRLDVDKRAILDSVGDENLDSVIRERLAVIWSVVTRERAKVMAGNHSPRVERHMFEGLRTRLARSSKP